MIDLVEFVHLLPVLLIVTALCWRAAGRGPRRGRFSRQPASLRPHADSSSPPPMIGHGGGLQAGAVLLRG